MSTAQPHTPTSPACLTVAEAAALARVHPITIYRWARDGRIVSSRIGHQRLIPRAAFTVALGLTAADPGDVSGGG